MEIVIQKLVVRIEMIFVLIQITILQSTFISKVCLSCHNLSSIRRENWRDQRSTGNSNRRGGGGGGNNPKQNQYNNSTTNRQQYNNRNPRNTRYADNQSSYEQRDLTLQTTNEEPTRNQRMNSGNYSQGQTSGPTSPSGTVSGRTIYSNTHRSAAVNRNSPVPYAGSSSSRKNSMSNTTSPPNQQSGPNKITRKQSIRKKNFSF